jgi:hypothetical protein
MTTDVEFFFDIACPWTWITSRWVVEVAPQRDVRVIWTPFSLRYRNKDNPGYDRLRSALNGQWPAMRVIEAARTRLGNDAVGRLYESLGTLIHHDGDDHLVRLAEGIAAAGVEESIIGAADDGSLDAALEASTDRALSIVGQDAGIPIIVLPGARNTFFGPVLSPAPTGDDALALWDAYVTLGRIDGLYEIKRSRSVGPQFGPRPSF